MTLLIFMLLLVLKYAGVVLLSMHQYSQPVKECILDLKSVQPEIEVAPVTAMKLIFSDGLVELVNFIISLCLLRFNSLKEKGDYSSRSYMLASALIPFCLGLFFNTERYGCVTDSNGEVILGANSVMTERQFPVSAVFHIIVTGCYWFMNMSMAQCDLNLEAVTRLQKELSSKNSRKKK